MSQVLQNANGHKYLVLEGELGSGKPALLCKLYDDSHPYVVASMLGTVDWLHGNYYNNLRLALEDYDGRVL
jgi:hypothetical protein